MTLPFSSSASPIASSDSSTADEAAGVHDDEIGVLIGGRDEIAFGAQLREDALGIDQRFRAAERNEADCGQCGTGHRKGRRRKSVKGNRGKTSIAQRMRFGQV